MKVQHTHTASSASRYSAFYSGCHMHEGKYQMYDCSNGYPKLNVYMDKVCTIALSSC
jgi:hypothetical protein